MVQRRLRRLPQSLSLENELRRAIEREELVLHYRRKAGLADGAVSGFEALLRWQHPQRGLVSPGNFVGILEDTGRIAELAPWLVRQAVADAALLNRGRGRRLRVAVSVSQVQMRRPDFVDSIARHLETTAPADCTLDIEITESLLIDDAEARSASSSACARSAWAAPSTTSAPATRRSSTSHGCRPTR